MAIVRKTQALSVVRRAFGPDVPEAKLMQAIEERVCDQGVLRLVRVS